MSGIGGALGLFPFVVLALVGVPCVALVGTLLLVVLKVWFAISWGWALSPLWLLVPWGALVLWIRSL